MDGLYSKYTVINNHTESKVYDCFVLKPLKDEAARLALLYYANICDNETLKNDIKTWLNDPSETNFDEASMGGCKGCIHYDGCGYFDLDFDNSNLTEEERFIEHCVGCCCGDCYDCNKNNGCDNWEDGSEPLLG